MYSFATILLCLGLAEVLRRCCMVLLKAFTGPMSKIPGPWLWKFSALPWMRVVLQGNQINVSPKLFATYGDVVRIGMSHWLRVTPDILKHLQVPTRSSSAARMRFRRSSWKKICLSHQIMRQSATSIKLRICSRKGITRHTSKR